MSVMPCRICRAQTTRRHATGAPLCQRCATPPAPGVVRAGTSKGVVEAASLDDIARQLGGPRAGWFRQSAYGADPVVIVVPDRRYVDGVRPVATLTWVQGA